MTPTESPADPSVVTQSPYLLPVLYVLLGVLIGAIGLQLFLWIWNRRGPRQPPYWTRLLGDSLAGSIAALILHILQHGFVKPSAANITEGLLHALIVALVIELVHTAHSLSEMGAKLEELYRRITGDERILIARTEPLEDRREISLIGVERLDSRQIPAPLERPSPTEEWALTISLLRLDRLQDLLFSTDYLKHFLKLHEATKKQYRLLVVNDKPRPGSEAAIRSFLQMSDTLGIETYVYLKSEFYEMFKCLDTVPRAARATAAIVKQIMDGQPELSLMHDDSTKGTPDTVTDTENYKLRFRDKSGRIVDLGPSIIPAIPIKRIDWVHRLMHVAIRESSRRGLDGFSRVLGPSCTNPWEDCSGRLGFLKHI